MAPFQGLSLGCLGYCILPPLVVTPQRHKKRLLLTVLTPEKAGWCLKNQHKHQRLLPHGGSKAHAHWSHNSLLAELGCQVLCLRIIDIEGRITLCDLKLSCALEIPPSHSY